MLSIDSCSITTAILSVEGLLQERIAPCEWLEQPLFQSHDHSRPMVNMLDDHDLVSVLAFGKYRLIEHKNYQIDGYGSCVFDCIELNSGK
jgi:hypothetical protein